VRSVLGRPVATAEREESRWAGESGGDGPRRLSPAELAGRGVVDVAVDADDDGHVGKLGEPVTGDGHAAIMRASARPWPLQVSVQVAAKRSEAVQTTSSSRLGWLSHEGEVSVLDLDEEGGVGSLGVHRVDADQAAGEVEALE
jgi:hypothetical protein